MDRRVGLTKWRWEVAALAWSLYPAIRLITSVRRWAVDVPFNDQWKLVPLLDPTHSLRFGDFWKLHNEHRLVFPRLVMVLLARFTGWDTRVEMATSTAMLVVVFGLVATGLAQIQRRSGMRFLLLLPLVSALVFSKTQAENVLWGWQIQILMCLVAVTSVFLILGRENVSWVWFLVSLILALVAQYSFANGVLVWLIGFGLLLSTTRKFHNIWQLATWSATGAISTLAYFWHWRTNSGASHLATNPMSNIRYALTFLGAPLARNTFECRLFGQRCDPLVRESERFGLALLIVLFAVTAVLVLTHQLRNAQSFLAIGAFGLLSSFVASLGRSEFGQLQALESRYTTFSLTTWLSAAVCIVIALQGLWHRFSKAAVASKVLLNPLHADEESSPNLFDGLVTPSSSDDRTQVPTQSGEQTQRPERGQTPRPPTKEPVRVGSKGRSIATAAGLATSVVLGSVFVARTASWQRWFTGRHDGLLMARNVLLENPSDDELFRPNQDAPTVRRLLPVLKNNHLSVFRGTKANAVDNSSVAVPSSKS